MNHAFHGATDRGRARENNEDALRIEPELGFAILADGMGGYNAGEVASALAVAVIGDSLGRWRASCANRPGDGAVRPAVCAAIEEANTVIRSDGLSDPGHAGMGTTVVVAVFDDRRVVIAHVGDSRAYRLRAGRLEPLTRDHSLLQLQIDAGLLTPEEALTAPNRNLVTRALGVEATVEVETHGHAVEPDDLLLICSDGLTDMLPDDMIAGLMAGRDNLVEIAQILIEAANAYGGRDNISVILVRSRERVAAG